MSNYNPDKILCVYEDEGHEWMDTLKGQVCVECGIPRENPKAFEETKTAEEVVTMIAEKINEWKGEEVSSIAYQILCKPVTYLGGGLFIVKEHKRI